MAFVIKCAECGSEVLKEIARLCCGLHFCSMRCLNRHVKNHGRKEKNNG